MDVLDASKEARITLTTCHPKYSARQRLIVSGVLSGEPVAPPLLGKRWRRWPSYLLGLPFGAFTLFLCFEQVARLLPSNI